MSYILEALKKAQAERQIGEMPTIHAPAMAPAAPEAGGLGARKLVMIAIGLLGGAVVVLGAMLLRQPVGAPAAPVAAVATPPVAQVVPAAVPAVAAAPALETSVAPVTPAPVTPAPVTPAPVATVAAAPAPPEPKKRVRPSEPAVAPVKLPADEPVRPAPEEYIQSQRELPEPIQRAIPPIAMGGYMYSKNPADRLLLIDKVLRKEGDEVAPGLQLEKLMPKAAVFSFRGYRYKVPL